MAILKKTLFAENLDRFNVLIEDTETFSKYFKITELPDTFTGGKNAFLIQGSPDLVADTIIKIEIKDALGNIIYHEPGNGIPEYYEGTSKVIAVYVYPDTAFGPATITILGELSTYDNNGIQTPIPLNWQGQYNVKWQTQINVNPSLANTTKIRFYRRPKVTMTESVLSVYNRSVTQNTLTGKVSGIPINPISGSDYKSFKGILQYQLEMSGSTNFSQSMEGLSMSIDVDGITYSPTITDVTTEKRAFINVPYYVTSSLAPNYQSVTGFKDKDFTITYDEDVLLTDSNVSSSFATITIADLEAFTGDPARIKVFASSRQDLGDYQLLEDIQLESSEIFLEREFNNQLNVRTGVFNELILNNFWVSQSIEANPIATIDNALLMKSVKLEPDNDFSSSVGLISFNYKTPLQFSKNTEYQLDFTPLLSSSVSGYGGLEIYLSGSAFANMHNSFGKEIYNEETNAPFRKYEKQQINFKPDMDGTGQVKFVVNGGTWQLSNISLRASHESSFAPNEITLIADIPTKINNETFDFRFELYDINNNYVPVTIEKVFTFAGGNDIKIKRDLSVTQTVNQFNFTTSSVFPNDILFDFTKTGLTGAVSFASAAVDTTGLYIDPSDVTMGTAYPGALEIVDVDTLRLTKESFTSSLSGGKVVGAVYYTASCEDINRYFTIYRVEQGAPSYLFYATADKNSFTYDPDNQFRSVITDDYIDIRLVQQNLPSTAPLVLSIYSGSEASGWNPPALVEQGSVGNATIYRLYASSSLSSSTYGYHYDLGQSHYDFELSTVDGIFTSSVLIDSVLKGKKGISAGFTNENTTLTAYSTGFVPSASFAATTGSISVKVGDTDIPYATTPTTNKFVASVASSNGVTGANINSLGQYSISRLDADSGSVGIQVTYYDTRLSSSVFTKEITYSKAKKSAPALDFIIGNSNQTSIAKSTGVQTSAYETASFSIKESYNGVTTTKSLVSAPTITATNSYSYGTATTTTLALPNMADATDSVDISITGSVIDSEGSTRNVFGNISLAKAKKAVPNVEVSVTPNAQSVIANSLGNNAGTPTTLSVSAKEGGTSRLTSVSAVGTNVTIGTISAGSIPLSNVVADTATVAITVNYTDSEGVTGSKPLTATITKAKSAAPATLISISPQAQTVQSSSAGTTTPSNATISVSEGGSNYTYGTSGNSTFQITNVTNGTNTNAIITPTTPTTTAGVSGVVTVSYINSEGTTVTGKTIPFNVGVAVAGRQGPGLLYIGDYATKKAATPTLVLNNSAYKQDAVSSGGKYYAWKGADGTQIQNTSAPPSGGNASWEEFTSFSAVATGLLIAEQSYVKETINVGTNTSGNANITIAGGSTSPYISIGQSTQGYNETGIFIGTSSSAQKLSLKGTNGSITWDGSNLSVTGDINAKSGTFTGNITSTATISGGTISGGAISGGTISIGSGNSIFKADSNGIYLGNATYGSAPFRVSPTGVLYATGATIGGTINASAGTFSGNITSTATITGGTIEGGSILGGSISIGANFSVNGSGTLTAVNANLSGTITATAGNIGGFSIANNTLSAAGNLMKIDTQAPALLLYQTDGGAPKVEINAKTTLTSPSAASIYPQWSAGQVGYIGTDGDRSATSNTTDVVTNFYGTLSDTFSVNDTGLVNFNVYTPDLYMSINGGTTTKIYGYSAYPNYSPTYDWQSYSSVSVRQRQASAYFVLQLLNAAGNTVLYESAQIGPSVYMTGGYYYTYYEAVYNGINGYYWNQVTAQGNGYATARLAFQLRNSTINIGAAGTYTARMVLRTTVGAGYVTDYDTNTTTYSPTTGTSNHNYAGVSLTLTPNLNKVEITNGGIQVLTTQDSYVQMQRADGGSWSGGDLLRVIGGKIVNQAYGSYPSYYETSAMEISGRLSVSSKGGNTLGITDYDTGTSAYTMLTIGGKYSDNVLARQTKVETLSNIYPYLDDKYDLGGTGYRWRDIFTNGAVTTTSDRTRKFEIQSASLGLDFINKLEPVSYKMVTGSMVYQTPWDNFIDKEIQPGELDELGNVVTELKVIKIPNPEHPPLIEVIPGKRRHYGLIAQDVKETLEEVGVSTNDFAGYVAGDIENDTELGLRYEEFIAPMIKAIQELSAKVEELQSKLNGSI